MSRWSISAMSPRERCLTSSFVRRPGRTGPVTVRQGATSPPGREAGADAGMGTSLEFLDAGSRGLRGFAAIAARVTAAGAKRTFCECSGGLAQILRVTPRSAVGGIGAEHADQLGDDLALGELDDRGAGRGRRRCP